ncbi:17216_t:CDS:2, partial [Dentiscutata erythropus]
MATRGRGKYRDTLAFKKESEKLTAREVFGISVDNPYATWRYFNVVGLGIDADTSASDTSSDINDTSFMNIDAVERSPSYVAPTNEDKQPIQSNRLKEAEFMQLQTSQTRFTASDQMLINLNKEDPPQNPFIFVREPKIFDDLLQIDWKEYLEMDFKER